MQFHFLVRYGIVRFAGRPELQALWDRLCAWSPDAPGSSHPFSVRLAAENGWPLSHALRVIEEYRRFALIAATAQNMMTPSDAVDQVWHLHLAYSRSYWDDFCPKVLGKPLHHEPTQGGAHENERFDGTYRATLARYGELFGPPPLDLWPAPELRFAARFQRVLIADRGRAGARLFEYFAGLRFQIPLLLGCLAMAGCAGLFTEHNTSGPSAAAFLNFYLYLTIGAVATALSLIWSGLAPRTRECTCALSDLDTYALAYLSRKDFGVLETVIATLYNAGHIGLGEGGGAFTSLAALPTSAHPIERAFVRDIDQHGRLPKGGGNAFKAAVQTLRDGLLARDLIPAPKQVTRVQRQLMFVGLAALMVGLIRVAVGVGGGRPVGFLLLLMVNMLVGLLILWRLTQRPNRHGRGILAQAKASAQPRSIRVNTGDTRLPLAVALLGTSALAFGTTQDLRRSIQSVSPTANGGDGGGGGCGGGGCGGGGCGG